MTEHACLRRWERYRITRGKAKTTRPSQLNNAVGIAWQQTNRNIVSVDTHHALPGYCFRHVMQVDVGRKTRLFYWLFVIL